MRGSTQNLQTVYASACVRVHVSLIYGWLHIKNERVKMKYSAILEKITHFQAICPCELCSGAAGKWCLSVSMDLTLSHSAFQGQHKNFISSETTLSYQG